MITGCAVPPALPCSPVLWQLCLSMGNGNFDPPQNPYPSAVHQKSFFSHDYVGNPYSYAKFHASPFMKGFCANG